MQRPQSLISLLAITLLLVPSPCAGAQGRQAPARVQWSIVDSAGKPLVGALATLGADSVPLQEIRTDSAGRVRYAVAPGRYVLTVIVSRFWRTFVPLDLRPGEQRSGTWVVPDLDLGLSCQADIRPAIRATIRDARSGRNLVPTARAYGILDGDSIPLVPETYPRDTTPPSTLTGGPERPGHYRVIVRHRGYAPWDHTILVSADACHVLTRELQVALEPAG